MLCLLHTLRLLCLFSSYVAAAPAAAAQLQQRQLASACTAAPCSCTCSSCQHTSSRQATAIYPFVQGPDAAGRPVLRILIGAAVTECRGNAALAFANAILTHMEQASARVVQCCELVERCPAMQSCNCWPVQQPSADVSRFAPAACIYPAPMLCSVAAAAVPISGCLTWSPAMLPSPACRGCRLACMMPLLSLRVTAAAAAAAPPHPCSLSFRSRQRATGSASVAFLAAAAAAMAAAVATAAAVLTVVAAVLPLPQGI